MVILDYSSARISERITQFDPVLIGRTIHECAAPEPASKESGDSQTPTEEIIATNEAIMAKLGVEGQYGGVSYNRTTADAILRSDGYETYFDGYGLSEPAGNMPKDVLVISYLSLQPLTVSQKLKKCDREERGVGTDYRIAGGNDPLLMAPWRDVEMLGQAVLTLFGLSCPPSVKGAVSVFLAAEPKGRIALHRAARDGLVEGLPVRGRRTRRNLDPVDAFGVTPLMLAAFNGHTDVSLHLLELGADPHVRDRHGRSALHFAADGGHEGVVDALVGAGADIEVADAIGDTPLHLAVVGGHAGAVERLLGAGALPGVGDAVFSATPLHKAARSDAAAVVPLLVDAGAYVDASNDDGRTPLHTAASYGHTETVRALIAAGGDVNRRDKRGETPLHGSAFYQHLDCMELLIGAGADVGARDGDGNTPLHVAGGMNRDRAARLLLESGAGVDAANREGMTPLDTAVANVHSDSYYDTVLTDIEGMPYMFAVHNSEVAEVLLSGGATIDPGRLPVGDRHCLWPRLTPRELLLDNGDLDYSRLAGLPQAVRDHYRAYPSSNLAMFKPTLLDDAVAKGMIGVVEALLKSGASPTPARREGTPLHTAVEHGSMEMAAMLIDYGADLDAPEWNYADGPPWFNEFDRGHLRYLVGMRTPLDMAIRTGQVEMARFLLGRGAAPPPDSVDAVRLRDDATLGLSAGIEWLREMASAEHPHAALALQWIMEIGEDVYNTSYREHQFHHQRRPWHPLERCPSDKHGVMVAVLREFGAVV